MCAMAFLCRLGFCLLLPLLPTALPEEAQPRSSADITVSCDDGKVGKDIDDLAQWTSCKEGKFKPPKFEEPSHREKCSPTLKDPSARCMDVPLTYTNHPPSSGDYRHMRPQYGMYDYLPPQRWLSALQYGAVVFLYHPCAPQDQVSQLKQLAHACLWRHFISPYPLLDRDWPMAVVSWGCVLRVKWVESEVIKKWVESHALHTPQTPDVTDDGTYSEGLVEKAEKVELNGKEVVCPSHSLPTPNPLTDPSTTNHSRNSNHSSKPICPSPPAPTNSTHNERDLDCVSPPAPSPLSPDPASSNPPPGYHYPPLHHHIGYTVLISVAASALLCMFLVFAWNLCCATHRRKHRRARYKSVSKFFPFSYGEQLDHDGGGEGVSVAIPEYGLPKNGRAEQEMLLNESDEDEI